MKLIFRVLIPVALILTGILLVIVGTHRPITIYIDGQPQVLYTHAITVGWALSSSNLTIDPDDHLQPPATQFLGWDDVIYLDRARQVNIWLPLQELSYSFLTVERLPANILQAIDLTLFPGDRLYWNGELIDPNKPLPLASFYNLQFQPGIPIAIEDDGRERTLYSAAPTLGEALWESGIIFKSTDKISPPYNETPLVSTSVTIHRSIPIQIKVGEQYVNSYSAAATIGEALAEAGVSLQTLDYSIPGENEPIPADGSIQVIRVREEVIIDQTPIPFENEYVADSEVELDQTKVIEAGQYGIKATRIRVRYEDDQEVSRQTEVKWVASEPNTQKIGYGNNVFIRSLDTPNGPLEYWRAVSVYATSYSPCRSGTSKCHYGTSYGLPVSRGVIGVTHQWYLLMAGQQVYVPGYGKGVIADVGGGIPGKYWIDLGFIDEEYESWHQTVTLYFLTPVPDSIPWILP